MPTVPAVPARSSHDRRNGILCALALVVAVSATWPVAELPYNDDWTYSWTVKQLNLTGQLTYNGWASASGIAQAYWGLIWVRIFGFHLTVLRLSTVPFAAGAVSVCYLLGRRAGLEARWAMLVALTLGWSPIFLPVAATFMTDAPGLFCILLGLYSFVRAIESSSQRRAIGWLIFGTVVGVVGGTGRQIVWLAPIVGLPYAALICRRDRPLVATAVGGFVLTIASALFTVHWFNRQPYAIPEPSVLRDLLFGLKHFPHLLRNLSSIALTLVLVSLPAMAGLLPNARRHRAILAAVVVTSSVFLIVFCHRVQTSKGALARISRTAMPWMENTLEPTGVMGRSQLSGDRPVVLTLDTRIVLSVLTVTASVLFLATAGAAVLRRRSGLVTGQWVYFTDVDCGPRTPVLRYAEEPGRGVQNSPGLRRTSDPAFQPVTTRLLILFAIVYSMFLLPRAARNMAYDRYVLELIPCLLIPLLRRYPPGKTTAPIAWLLLGIWGLYGIASTQEVTSLARARVTATDRLLNAGYRRADITAGFEYDYMTQIVDRGYINDVRIKNPPGAYIDGDPTPGVQAMLRVEFTPAPDTRPTRFGSVDYFSLLPPFRRSILIDEFKDPYWRAPGYAESHRHEHNHRMLKDEAAEP